jgi:serine/threonine protein kinase
MGVVYEAEQQHPRRPVALKVVRGGEYVSEDVIRMFRREAQVLARLKHPGIASIYESGRTDDGYHFFAMELVRGRTLGDYVGERVVDGPPGADEIRHRLALFLKICDAVSFAHQRGVVHRDLKPSNILVLRLQEEHTSDVDLPTVPGTKILDFGLARITDGDVAVTTVVTQAGKVEGTLAYMSPEQTLGNPDEIDLRSDIYSLGVILYELLADELPYEVNRGMLPEAIRAIREDAPPSLRTRAERAKRIPRDLETIVFKALEKDPARRYQSVAALADDLERYLRNQPILARAPSTIYLLKKAISRHKIRFSMAALLVLMLVLSSVAMSFQAARIARERDRADREARTAQRVTEFLIGLFELTDPEAESWEGDLTVRELLDRGVNRLDTGLESQPLIRAQLMQSMSKAYRNLGLYAPAMDLAHRIIATRSEVLGEEHPDVANAWTSLSRIQWRLGTVAEAEASVRRAIRIQEAVLEPDHPDLTASLNMLANALWYQQKYAEAKPYYEKALELRQQRHAGGDITITDSLVNLGLVYKFEGRWDRAEELFREGRRNIRFADEASPLREGFVAYSLADLLVDRDRPEPAEPLIENALLVLAETNENPHLSAALMTKSAWLRAVGRDEESDSLVRRAIVIDSGGEFPSGDLREDRDRLLTKARWYFNAVQLSAAELLYEKALALNASLVNPDDNMAATMHWEWARASLIRGHYDDARDHLRRAREQSDDGSDVQDGLPARIRHDESCMYQRRGNREAAQAALEDALSLGLGERVRPDPVTVFLCPDLLPDR